MSVADEGFHRSDAGESSHCDKGEGGDYAILWGR